MAEYTDPLLAVSERGGKPRLSESRWAWNQVAVAFLTGGLFNGLMIYSYSALIALIAVDIPATQTQLMYPKTAMMGAGALLAPVLGILVDRYSIKRFLLLGVVVFTTGLAVVNTADSILRLTLIFALFFGPLQSPAGAADDLSPGVPLVQASPRPGDWHHQRGY